MLILSHLSRFIYLLYPPFTIPVVAFCQGALILFFLNNNTQTKCLANEEGPKFLCGLGSDHRRGRPFQCGMVQGKFEMDSSEHHYKSGIYSIEHYVKTW